MVLMLIVVFCFLPSWLELLVTFLVIELDIGGVHLTYLVFITICNPFGRNPHVDCHIHFPPFWLQLLATLLIVVILILVVQVWHFLCLQLVATLLVMILLLIIVFIFLCLGYNY